MNSAKKVWLVFSSDERLWLVALITLLLATSLMELVGLVLVIPYVNLMLFETVKKEYIEIFPPLEFMLSLSDNYRLDATLWFGGFYILKNGALAVMAFIQHSIQKSLHANIVKRMYHNYMQKPYAFHLQSNSSDVIRSLTYDAMHFGDGVLAQSGILIAELFLFLGVISILSTQNSDALMIIMVMALFLGLIFTVIKKRLVLWSMILQRREAGLIRQLQEGLGGIKDVVVFGVQNFFESEFGKNVELRSRMKRNRDVAVLFPRFVIETLMMVGMAGVLMWLSKEGELEQNFSMITFLAVVLVRMLPMSNRIMNSISTIRGCTASIDVVYEHAQEHADMSAVKPLEQNISAFKTIDVQGLDFSYTSNNPLLKGISFSIENGETVGIVGSSGAGKTTLVDILLGLLVPTSGRIMQNKTEDIHSNLPAWQNRIGYVQQSIFLLDDTIEANIAYGIPGEQVDHNRVKEVINLAKLDAWVESLPAGLQSKVGERGVSISGGQRQRVGIARALYRHPEILMLDEATSALDNRTEKELMADVYSMRGDRTIILIAHRLDTIRKCDRIIVLDQGTIAGIGAYDDLLANNAVFQKISAHQ